MSNTIITVKNNLPVYISESGNYELIIETQEFNCIIKADNNINVNINSQVNLLCNNFVANISINSNSNVNWINNYNELIKFNVKKSSTDNNLVWNHNLNSKTNFSFSDINLIASDINFFLKSNLLHEQSSYKLNMASLSLFNFKKEFIIEVMHSAINSYSDIKTYSICRNSSKQSFDCKTIIYPKMHGSEVHQDLRLTVFDKNAAAISNPTLLINDNDVVATHANAVGMLDPNVLFYLQTRGVSKEMAKLLIAMGYFKLLNNQWFDENKKNIINNLIINLMKQASEWNEVNNGD